MQRFTIKSIATAILMVHAAAVQGFAEDPWADAVVEYSPLSPVPGFTDAAKALGAPVGGKVGQPDNASVVSLGTPRGRITLKFDTPVTDDPANPLGLDCIVYSNSFWTGGDPQLKFQEPAIIEISRDVNSNGLADDPWFLIPGSRGLGFAGGLTPVISEPDGQDNTADPLLLGGSIRNPNATDANPSNDAEEFNWGYAELTPTVQEYLDNYVRPDNPFLIGISPRSGGGDAFDIQWALTTSGAPANLTQFDFVRITTLVDRVMPGLGVVTAEIDAAADVAPNVDSDGDGILDEYETRVAGTDPARRESTVLALEVPVVFGGSPMGSSLGFAEDGDGNRIELISSGPRTAFPRTLNIVVDITSPPEPGGTLPGGLLKSQAVRMFSSSEADFVAAEVAPALMTMYYHPLDVAGLDENNLQPYRFDAGAYTQADITFLSLDTDTNLVTFTSRFAGTFLLTSTAGAGDPDVVLPQGTIALAATPSGSVVADPMNSVSVLSNTILTYEGNPVADGEFFTITTTRGTIAAADADPGTPGLQIGASGGSLAFTVGASQQAGALIISANSLRGVAAGTLGFAFAPGPPAPPIQFFTTARTETPTLITLTLVSTVVRDQFANPVTDATLLTVTMQDAVIVSADADLGAAGHQVAVSGGLLLLTVEVPIAGTSLTVSVFSDAGLTQLLDSQVLQSNEFFALPAGGTALLLPFFILFGVVLLKRGAPSRMTKHDR